MLNKIKEILNTHEHNNNQRDLNERAISDLFSAQGHFHPSRALALHNGYKLDSFIHGYEDTHHRNHEKWGRNFDDIGLEERQHIDDEIVQLAQLAAILHDPSYLLEKIPPKWSSMLMARDYLRDSLKRHGPKIDKINDEVYKPLAHYFKDNLDDENNYINSILPHAMVHNLPHKAQNYKTLLKHELVGHLNKDEILKNWHTDNLINHMT